MLNKVNLLLEGAWTQRFHTVHTIKQETVAHHSNVVAGLIFLIWPDCSRDLLVHATFHDIAECKTGDIPSPSKRKFIDREKMNAHEDQVFVEHEIFLPLLTVEDKRRLKIADILSGISFCLHERVMGNNHTAEALKNFTSYFKEMGPHEKPVIDAYNSIIASSLLSMIPQDSEFVPVI